MEPENFTVAVVGGGLVGSLLAVSLAKRGWNVDLYEKRSDLRKDVNNSGRSINLSLSERGIAALKEVGVGSEIFDSLIPMKGRLIHTTTGKLVSQDYGVNGECINSVDRLLVNKVLLNVCDSLPNVTLHFNHVLDSCDIEKGTLKFGLPGGESLYAEKHANLIIGADGAYSKMRGILQRSVRMSFSQQYIDHAWCELTILPDEKGNAKIDTRHLHIWPRHEFMMIALPNVDNSFTVTLFMPWSVYDGIITKEHLIKHFEDYFPDSLDVLGRDFLIEEYFKNPKGQLMTVKCDMYNYKHHALIIGDASHAMVPFYGQGMNCGFEDVSVLSKILDKHIPNSTYPTPTILSAALDEYSKTRSSDVQAACDLALGNYKEMRSSVVKASYLVKKKVLGVLNRLFPNSVIPLYTMVSFSRIPYAEALRKTQRQDFWLGLVGNGVLGVGVLGGVLAFGLSPFGRKISAAVSDLF